MNIGSIDISKAVEIHLGNQPANGATNSQAKLRLLGGAALAIFRSTKNTLSQHLQQPWPLGTLSSFPPLSALSDLFKYGQTSLNSSGECAPENTWYDTGLHSSLQKCTVWATIQS